MSERNVTGVIELVEALQQIRDREPDQSSSDQTAFFWTWAKRIASDALAKWEQAQK